MAKKRGFLAEVNRQLQQDARRREQAQRQASRAHATAQRNADQAARQAERAQTQLLRATAAEMKRAEQEFKRLHVAAMEAEAEARNAELAAEYEQIDHILEATLGVDDYVDLERLRRVADHPPFKPATSAFQRCRRHRCRLRQSRSSLRLMERRRGCQA